MPADTNHLISNSIEHHDDPCFDEHPEPTRSMRLFDIV